MASPTSCLSCLSSSQESDPTIGSPNPWFDFYNRIPTTSDETDPNWGRSITYEDEEIQGMFDLQLDLQYLYIENLFPSSDEESLDEKDLVFNFDVRGPFSCMDTFFLYD